MSIHLPFLIQNGRFFSEVKLTAYKLLKNTFHCFEYSLHKPAFRLLSKYKWAVWSKQKYSIDNKNKVLNFDLFNQKISPSRLWNTNKNMFVSKEFGIKALQKVNYERSPGIIIFKMLLAFLLSSWTFFWAWPWMCVSTLPLSFPTPQSCPAGKESPRQTCEH